VDVLGNTCPRPFPRGVPVGGDGSSGKIKEFLLPSTNISSPGLTNRENYGWKKPFLTEALFQPKKGGLCWKNQVGKGIDVDGNGTPLNVEVESAATYEGHVAEKTVDSIINDRNKRNALYRNG
jgi:hypothetical protein